MVELFFAKTVDDLLTDHPLFIYSFMITSLSYMHRANILPPATACNKAFHMKTFTFPNKKTYIRVRGIVQAHGHKLFSCFIVAQYVTSHLTYTKTSRPAYNTPIKPLPMLLH